MYKIRSFSTTVGAEKASPVGGIRGQSSEGLADLLSGNITTGHSDEEEGGDTLPP
jgi:hypothetical protein